MSAFIGPIHYWLYKKIRVVIDRENAIYEAAAELCGDAAEEVRQQAWQTYGEPLPEQDLQHLIDHDNIHGWLQKQINVAESREALLVKELYDMCGSCAGDAAATAFAAQGKECGQAAKTQSRHDISTAPGVYQLLQDYYLNGMPCDQADMIVLSQPDQLVWRCTQWLQQKNWQRSGADSHLMAGLYCKWLAAFISTVNPEFTLKMQETAGGLEFSLQKS